MQTGRNTLKIRFTLFFVFFVLAVFSVVVVISIQQYNEAASVTASRLGYPVVKRAVALIDGDKFERLAKSLDPSDPFYDETRLKLLALKNETQCLYLYTMAAYPGGVHRFIIDGGNPDDEGFSPLGAQEDLSNYTDAYLKTFETKQPQFGDMNLQGSWGWLISSYAPIFNSSGQMVGLVGCDFEAESIYDTIHRRIMQQLAISAVFIAIGLVVYFYLLKTITRQNDKLLEMTSKAETASRSKSAFLSNMSHEMRTPLNAIIGMASIGRHAADIEKKDYAFTRVADASTHLLGVINDILDMSKIEADKLDLSNVEFPIEGMLRNVVNIVNFRVEERRQNFYVNIDRNIPEILVGDDQRLAQIIANLLSNAVKFTPEGGSIRLGVYLAGEKDGVYTIQVKVTDTGIGISKEQQTRLFHSFEQAESGTARKYGGTGLGLAISKRIVEMMGGEIHIESELDKGSVFTFTVQLGRGSGESSVPSLPGLDRPGLRVLVVDAAPGAQEYFADIAERFHIVCDVADGDRQAFALIGRNGPYDISFVDWNTSGEGWLDMVGGLRQRSGDSPIIMMMPLAEWNALGKEAERAGANGLLLKPLFPSSIADCINEHLRLWMTGESVKAGQKWQMGQTEPDGQNG
ncbi:MAG: response regulator, partial [Acidobacteriota bacterium]|nr:response regulator [Acidobacteriota bacterium]